MLIVWHRNTNVQCFQKGIYILCVPGLGADVEWNNAFRRGMGTWIRCACKLFLYGDICHCRLFIFTEGLGPVNYSCIFEKWEGRRRKTECEKGVERQQSDAFTDNNQNHHINNHNNQINHT